MQSLQLGMITSDPERLCFLLGPSTSHLYGRALRARRWGGDFVGANLDRPCQPFEDHRADLPPRKRVHLDGNRFPGAVDRMDNRARGPRPPGSDGEKQDGIWDGARGGRGKRECAKPRGANHRNGFSRSQKDVPIGLNPYGKRINDRSLGIWNF